MCSTRSISSAPGFDSSQSYLEIGMLERMIEVGLADETTLFGLVIMNEAGSHSR